MQLGWGGGEKRGCLEVVRCKQDQIAVFLMKRLNLTMTQYPRAQSLWPHGWVCTDCGLLAVLFRLRFQRGERKYTLRLAQSTDKHF